MATVIKILCCKAILASWKKTFRQAHANQVMKRKLQDWQWMVKIESWILNLKNWQVMSEYKTSSKMRHKH